MKRKNKRARGRPELYDSILAERICAHIAEDRLSLREACRLKDMPNRRTVSRWLENHHEFRLQYARACEERADGLAEDAMSTVEGSAADTQVKVARDRLKFDATRWFLSKVAPKKYGDRQVVAGDPEAPQLHRHEVDVKVSAEESYRRMLGGG